MKGAGSPVEEHSYKLMKRMATGRWESRVFTIDEQGVSWRGRKKNKLLALKDIVGVAPSTVHEPTLFKGCAFVVEVRRPRKDKPKTYVLAAMSQQQAAAVVARIEAMRFPGRRREQATKAKTGSVSPRQERREESAPSTPSCASAPPEVKRQRYLTVVSVEVPVDADFDVESMLEEAVAQLTALGCAVRVARGRIIWEMQLEGDSASALQRGERRARREAETVGEAFRARREHETAALWSASSNESMMLDPPLMTTAVYKTDDLDTDVGKLLDEIYD